MNEKRRKPSELPEMVCEMRPPSLMPRPDRRVDGKISRAGEASCKPYFIPLGRMNHLSATTSRIIAANMRTPAPTSSLFMSTSLAATAAASQITDPAFYGYTSISILESENTLCTFIEFI
jgi:hypothetical protein